MKYILSVACIVTSVTALSQSMSYDTLRIPNRTALLLTADTLVVNHLIMGDSSTIILGAGITLIKAFRIEVGMNCSIIGDGMDALGAREVSSALDARQVGQGENGKSLTLMPTFFDAKSALSIFLNGGNGVDGDLSHLPGSGGKGGDLLFISSSCEKSKVHRQIILRNEGGNPGQSAQAPSTTDMASKKGDYRIIVNP